MKKFLIGIALFITAIFAQIPPSNYAVGFPVHAINIDSAAVAAVCSTINCDSTGTGKMVRQTNPVLKTLVTDSGRFTVTQNSRLLGAFNRIGPIIPNPPTDSAINGSLLVTASAPSSNVLSIQNADSGGCNGLRFLRGQNIGVAEMGAVGSCNEAAGFYGGTVYWEASSDTTHKFRTQLITGNIWPDGHIMTRATFNSDGSVGIYARDPTAQTFGGVVELDNLIGGRASIAGDNNARITLRDGGNVNNYWTFGGTLANQQGHVFLTGGLKAAQTPKLIIPDDTIGMFIPLKVVGGITSTGRVKSAGTDTANALFVTTRIDASDLFLGNNLHVAGSGQMNSLDVNSNAFISADGVISVLGARNFGDDTVDNVLKVQGHIKSSGNDTANRYYSSGIDTAGGFYTGGNIDFTGAMHGGSITAGAIYGTSLQTPGNAIVSDTLFVGHCIGCTDGSLSSIQDNADSLFGGNFLSLSGLIPNASVIPSFHQTGGGHPELITTDFDGTSGADTIASLGSIRSFVATRILSPIGSPQGLGTGDTANFDGLSVSSEMNLPFIPSNRFLAQDGSNQVVGYPFIGGGSVPLDTSGTFTCTLTGVTATVSGTCKYTVIGKQVTLTIPTLIGTTNANTMTVTGLPAVITPASQVWTSRTVALNNNSYSAGAYATIETSGVVTFYLAQGTTPGYASNTFISSVLDKGNPIPIPLTYILP